MTFTFIPTQTGFMCSEHLRNVVKQSPQDKSPPPAVPFRATRLGNRFPRQQGLLERREDVSLLVTLFV